MLVMVESLVFQEFQEFWGLSEDPMLGDTLEESSELPTPLFDETAIIIDQHVHQRFVREWRHYAAWVSHLKLLLERREIGEPPPHLRGLVHLGLLRFPICWVPECEAGTHQVFSVPRLGEF